MEYKNTSSEKLFQSVYFLFFGYLIWWVTMKGRGVRSENESKQHSAKNFGSQFGQVFWVASFRILWNEIND